MRRRAIVLAGLVAIAAFAREADAQTLNPGPPGPFVIDVRGVTSGVPGDGFFATLGTGSLVPTRGYGGSLGAHVYAFGLGPARFGAGVDVMFARGTSVDAASTLVDVAPQISANFGSSDGWSYLSAGVGRARIDLDPGGSTTVGSVNYGGGARWFLGPHLGIGFDLRVHRLASGTIGTHVTPTASAFAATVGFSIK
jgi:hypothetical protein